MSTSIFNTTRQANSRARAASSEYALVTLGGRTELGQSVTGNYTRQIQTIFEIGSTGIMWISGHEQGSLAFSRLVGAQGFFSGWNPDGCGEIKPVAINLSGGPCVAVARGGLGFDGTILESYNFALQAGTLEITEGVNLRVANLSRI